MGSLTGEAAGTMVCETAFGWVGIAWSLQVLLCVTLPRASEAEALNLLPPPTTGAPGAATAVDVDGLARDLRLYFDGQQVTFDQPLDPDIGTPFQKRIWAITRAIRRGEVRTYGQIAREAGSPNGARAAGQAMARNPWPIVVPCHRVVGSDGRLTGFGGGLPMKRSMLVLEGAVESTAT
jgi:methylated-DNA-[protein]-cysteine S-methyltransferase